MADPKHEESFKVVDRRLFTPEGELRKEAAELEERERQAEAVKQRQAGASSGKAAAPTGAKDASKTTAAAAPANESPDSSRSFQLLVDFLTRNAAAMLGGMADPQTGQPFVDLEGAREVIDMLDVLREKTRGNLSGEDERFLLEVIGSLKLSYMDISKAAAEAMAKKAKGK